jgi:adenosyl cobinamide kinase/adenosyl cobinamide phosphate guanylyltransferase
MERSDVKMRQEDWETLSKLDMRVTILESNQKETTRGIDKHSTLLDKLTIQNTDLTLALNNISAKLESLISQIGNASKVLSWGFVLISTLIGGAWTYSQYVTKEFEKISTNQHKMIEQGVIIEKHTSP